MTMVGFNGTTLPESATVDLAQRNLSNVIFLDRNCSSPLQIQQLTSAIRTSAQTAPFIAVDEEGGYVARLNRSNKFDSTYTAFKLGTLFNSVDSTARQAARMAGWLHASGFNTNFAPVANMNVNPQSPAIGHYGRSFSSVTQIVAFHAQVFIEERHVRVPPCVSFRLRWRAALLFHLPAQLCRLQEIYRAREMNAMLAPWPSSFALPFR